MEENGIKDMSQLADTVEKMHRRFYDLTKKINAAERRLGTLTEHLTQYEIYKQHQDVYKKYKQLDPKKRDAFYDRHSEGIQLYEAAKQYLDGVMNGHTKLPIKVWEKEAVKLTADKYALLDEFYRLKEGIKSMEVLKRTAAKLMGEVEPERTSARTRGLER